ncbi:MAG: glycine cleavage system aminomethyltransferase GcvT, partial [Candidatus Dadabacteria bacterium]
HYMLCVNAANAEKDFNWLTSHNKFNAEFINRSDEYGQLALQGPLAEKILLKVEGGSEPVQLSYFGFGEFGLAGMNLIVARTGYTGEDGFEFFVPKDQLATFWQVLMQAGEPLGLEPIGLGARDTLRLEACYPLHGHELSEDITAIESGLGWIVKPKKGDFIGREVLSAQKKEGAPRKLIGFFVEGRGIARHGDRILSNAGEELGVVTSGTKTPTVDRALGLALVRSSALNEGDHFKIEVRGRLLDALVVPTPFYKRTKR